MLPKKLGRWGLVVGAAALLLWAGRQRSSAAGIASPNQLTSLADQGRETVFLRSPGGPHGGDELRVHPLPGQLPAADQGAAIKNAGGAEQQISYGTNFPLNQWRHVAVVLSGNTGRLYLSGIQVAQNTNLVLNPINLGATSNVWLGRSQYTADPYLNGTLDDVRMSCRAYSAEDVAALAAL